MSFRISEYLFTPNSILLPLAWIFFIVISRRRLHPGAVPATRQAWFVLCAATTGGLLGAYFHGVLAGPAGAVAGRAWVDLRFGSLGGYWGALAAAAAGAGLLRQPPLKTAGALIPGILSGGAIARLGCLFTGCCRGIPIECGVQIFRLWPLYDFAALLLTLGATAHVRQRSHLGVFLLTYGVLRFGIEFLRVADPIFGPLTLGQIMAVAQVVAGATLFAALKSKRSHSS